MQPDVSVMVEEASTSSGPALLAPFALRGRVLKNRMVISPMCQHSAVDGFVQDWHVVHYGKFALGGAALVLTESTAVTSDSRVGFADLGIWDDAHVPGLRRLTEFAHQNGALFGIQLAHAGRKAFSEPLWEGGRPLTVEALQESGLEWRRVGPSAIAASPEWSEPEALSVDEIHEIQDAFVQAARRADEANADVIELHCGHGYLLASFLSPHANSRTDAYGGSLENRMRMVVETARAVRAIWPEDKPLFARLSCVDGAEGGWDMEDTVVLSAALQAEGVDVIDCSSGGLTEATRRSNVPRGIGFQVPFAAEVRERIGIATQTVGIILTPEQANEIVASGKADLVALGREALRTPYWPAEAARALGQEEPFAAWPLQHRDWLARRQTALDRLQDKSER
jgi:2,4-dienoyl-CoA reductase-like NADH-dependent reductase (Old Yellow Enzyme family)